MGCAPYMWVQSGAGGHIVQLCIYPQNDKRLHLLLNSNHYPAQANLNTNYVPICTRHTHTPPISIRGLAHLFHVLELFNVLSSYKSSLSYHFRDLVQNPKCIVFVSKTLQVCAHAG